MHQSIYVENSKNSKLSDGSNKVDATYLPIQNVCSDSCQLKNNGCYAGVGYVGIVVNRLEKKYGELTTLQVARAEAMAIDNSYSGGKVPDGRILRLHVSGDSRTVKGSKLINSSVGRWKKRGKNLAAYGYTHSWKNVPRSAWNHVSMLASVDNIAQANEARKLGYAPAIVVPEFSGDKVFVLKGSETKWIPCPAQTKDVSCSTCKLCARSDYLVESNHGIAFAAHGAGANKIKKRLTVIK